MLNPYDRTVVPGSILKIEDENFVADASGKPTKQRQQLYIYAISAKRYALFSLDASGRVVMEKCSEHGLGHLLNPLAKSEEELETRLDAQI